MSVGFDAASEFPTTASAGASLTLTLSWSHVAVTSTPKGVGLFIVAAPQSLTLVTSVMYGGASLTRRAFTADTANEPGTCEFWYLGSGVPTGTNNTFNVVTTSSDAGLWASGFTVSASFDTTVTNVLTQSENQAGTEQTLTGNAGALRFAAAYAGLATPPGAGANSTVLDSIDFGSFAARSVVETTGGDGARPVGFSSGNDDWAAIFLVVDEVAKSTISATGLASSFAAGAASLTSKAYISATGVASSFAVGSHTVSQPTTATLSVSATVPPGWKYTVFGTPNTTSQYSVAFNSSPTLASTDMVIFQEFAQSGGVTRSESVTISTNGIVTFSTRDPSASLSFKYFFWDESASAYGSTATWTSPPIQTVTATGKSTDEAYGTAVLTSKYHVSATGLASEAAFGTAALTSKAYISATGLATEAAFGAHTIWRFHQYISATGVSSNFAVGGHTVALAGSASTATLSVSATLPAGWKYTVLSNPDLSDTYGIAYGQSPTLVTSDMVIFREFCTKDGTTTSYSLTISTDGSITIFSQSDSSSLSFLYFFWDESTSAYGTTGTYNVLEYIHLAPTGFASEFTAGAHTVANKYEYISATGLATSAAFGSHSISSGGQYLSATGLVSAEAFGGHTVTAGSVDVSPTGLASTEAFGTHILAAGSVLIIPTGLSSEEGFGTHVLTAGAVSVLPTGLGTSEAFGAHSLESVYALQPTGLASTFTVGTHTLVFTQYISPSGQEYLVIGTPRVHFAGVTPLAVHDIFEWIYETAEASAIQGGIMKKTRGYLLSQGYSGTVNTAMFNWLRGLGYTGSLTDMIDQFERANTIQHG